MEFCRLCAAGHKKETLSNRPTNSINEATADEVDGMLKIFRNIEVNVASSLSTYTCASCLQNLKFCYQFYQKVLNTSKLLAQHESISIFRKIAPKLTTTPSGEDDNSGKSRQRKRRYNCQECPVQFTSYRQMLSHHQVHEIPNVCQYCGTFFMDRKMLPLHIKSSHDELKYDCLECQNSFLSRNSLFKHFRRLHRRTCRNYYCNECKEEVQIYPGRKSLDDHIQLAHPEFQAQVASDEPRGQDVDNIEPPDMIEEFLDDMDEEFLDEILLNQDQNSSFCWDEISITPFDEDLIPPAFEVDTQKSDGYKCPQCDENFAVQKTLIQHLAHRHDEYVLICSACGSAFNRYTKLKEHRNSHTRTSDVLHRTMPDGVGTTIMRCSYCDKTYKTATGLKYHLRTHAGSKPFRCPYCGRAFRASINLNAHLRNVHAKTKANECTLCDRKFATLDHLKKHVLSVHQKERNHLCSVCGRSFSQSSHLTQHSFIHSGQRPFHCSHCTLGFFKRIDLKRHLENIHNGQPLQETIKTN